MITGILVWYLVSGAGAQHLPFPGVLGELGRPEVLRRGLVGSSEPGQQVGPDRR